MRPGGIISLKKKLPRKERVVAVHEGSLWGGKWEDLKIF